MANEILISSVTGLTPSIQLYNGTIPIGSPFNATEISNTGEYVADMPPVPYGKYLVIVTAGNEKLGSDEIMWDGKHEITTSLAMMQGLDPNNPATTTQQSIKAGDINITLSGDGETSTTLTRNA